MSIIATFSYTRTVHAVVGQLFEPIIRASLSNGTIRLHHLLFLDSGADISLIPASLGTALGLKRDQQQIAHVRGFKGEHTGLEIVQLTLQIGNAAPVPIRAAWADDENVPALLGRLDVFDHYTFEFNHDRRMVIVRQ